MNTFANTVTLRRIILLTACFTSIVASSKVFAFDPDLSTVKIFSGLCSGDKDKFRGSGLLFSYQNDIYVLTSEHVLLHDNVSHGQKICHRYWSQTLGDSPATLIRADWGSGLAVLKSTGGTKPTAIPSFQDLQGVPLSAGVPAATYGFPFDSSALFSGQDGTILNAQSDRAFIPLISRVIEITKSHGEYGMSGGPIFSGYDNSFLGILTHQYVQYVPGGATEVGEYSATQLARADHLFAVSRTDVQAWLANVFEISDRGAPTIVRDAFLQLANQQEAVFSSGLRFTLRNAADASTPIGGSNSRKGGIDGNGIGGIDGHGIGGGDGHGIGGADGHGIGGNTASKTSNSILVEVTLDVQNHLARWQFLDESPWIAEIKAQLLRNHRIQIPFFVEDDINGLPKKRSFQTLAQFFNWLQNSRYRPATMILDGVTLAQDRNTHDQVVQAIQDSGVSLKAKVGSFQNLVDSEQIVARLYLSDVMTLAEIVSTGDWLLLNESWVNSLSKREDALKDLIALRFDETVELMRLVNDIQSDLAKLTVMGAAPEGAAAK